MQTYLMILMTEFDDDINFQILETLAKIIIKSCPRERRSFSNHKRVTVNLILGKTMHPKFSVLGMCK